jgi:NTE family protein
MKLFNWLSGSKTEPSHQNESTLGLGIALSGGSARGFAHIGVLKALGEHGVKPEVISGTSMGALVGVLFAAGHSPEKIQKLVNTKPIIKMVRPAWGKNGLFKMNELRKLLENEISTDDFSALKIPLYVAVANINKGKNEIINSGPLFDYILASCAVPIVFAPQVINKTTYIDGGLFDNLPADAIRDKCQILLGVHVNYIGDVESFSGTKEIAERAFILSIGENVKPAMKLCDYIINPPEMHNYSFWDFDKADDIINTGYRYTIQQIEKGELPVHRLNP